MTPEQIAEGRRVLADALRTDAMPVTARERDLAQSEYRVWVENNLRELLDVAEDAAERAEAAERKLAKAQESLQAGRDLMAVVHGDGGHYREQYGDRKASEDAITIVGALRVAYDDALRKFLEAQADSERFEWWFNRDVDKRDFLPTYFQGIRERWSLSNWRAAIDAERGK